MKKMRSRKWLAVMLIAGLVAGAFSGCGKAKEESGSSSGAAQDSVPESGKGRYVERQETLPEEMADLNIVQMFAADGKLHLLTTKNQDGKTTFKEWEKQESGFADVTEGWLASLELSCGDWLEAELSQGDGGVQYLYAGYVAEGEDAYKGHLWKGEGDVGTEITPERWTVPDEEWGSYDMIQGVAALKNGTLLAISYTSMDILSGEDGSLIESEPLSSFYEGGIVTDGENVYLRSSDGSGGQIEKRRDGKGEAVVIPFPTGKGAMTSDGAGSSLIEIGGSGSLALSALPDGTLVAGGEQGIFRLEAGAGEGDWEQLAEGMDTDFALSDCYCLDFVALENGCIYGLFEQNGERKLNCYEYDPDAVSEVTTVLTLYTVYENSLLKQAATMYHKLHPEVLIKIENEYPMYYYGTPDYDSVFQKLNTRLLGDNAPDILVMDHLNTDSYAEKGLLADLEEVVRPLEESGELLSNITGSYRKEDGKRYVVPLQFSFNLTIGRDIPVENMGSIEKLAGFLAEMPDSYMGNQTVDELVDKFYPYFCQEIVKDKQLDREALGRYLEYLKVIGDNCGIIASRPENEVVYGMWDLGGAAKLAFENAGGFIDCMFPMSMVDYIKGDFTAFENRFIPAMEMGICSKSQYQEVAKDFLQFALSQKVQDTETYSGFPVNSGSLKKLAGKDRSDYSAATMIMADDGGYLEFESKAYSQETADRLVALCGGLTKPVKEDAKIRQVLVECLGGYLDGSQTLEDTIQKIDDSLRMYLAE